jgi:DNA gyrase/topoisomerase IV subunit B
VLDNAVDEVQGGWGDEVTVSVDTGTQAVTITDNGR